MWYKGWISKCWVSYQQGENAKENLENTLKIHWKAQLRYIYLYMSVRHSSIRLSVCLSVRSSVRPSVMPTTGTRIYGPLGPLNFVKFIKITFAWYQLNLDLYGLKMIKQIQLELNLTHAGISLWFWLEFTKLIFRSLWTIDYVNQSLPTNKLTEIWVWTR